MKYFIIIATKQNVTHSTYVPAETLVEALKIADSFDDSKNRILQNIIEIDADSFNYLIGKSTLKKQIK